MKKVIVFLIFLTTLFACCKVKDFSGSKSTTSSNPVEISVDTVGYELDTDGDGVIDKTDELKYEELKGDAIEKDKVVIKKSKKLKTKKTTSAKPISLETEERKIGQINHIIKDTMEFGVADTVEITISYNYSKSSIVKEVSTFQGRQNNVVTQDIKITPVMRAKLIDPTNKSFIIVPITDMDQIVEMEDSTFTLWRWMVTPISGGDKYLVLSVDMLVGDKQKSIKIYQDKIFVHIGFWSKVWMFIQNYWTYITYVIGGIFTIFAWIYKEKILGLFKSKS